MAEMNLSQFILELRQTNIFTEDEVNEIISKIRKYEHRMVIGSRSVDDFKSFIKYEEGLLLGLKIRKKVRSSNEKLRHLEGIFKKRLLGTYRRGIKLFNQCNKIEETKNILLVGESLPPYSKDTYLDIINFELKNPMANGVQERLKIYVDDMVKNNLSYTFLVELVKMFKKTPVIVNVADYVIEQMLCYYRHEPRVWHFVALEELKGEYYPSGNTDKKSTSYSIERSVARYNEGILELQSQDKDDLWSFYLETLIRVQMQYTNPQTTSLLLNTFDRAAASEIKLCEPDILIWIDICGENHVRLVNAFEAGVKNVTKSISIWARYIKHYILQDEPELAKKVFDRANIAIGQGSIKLWEILLDFPKLETVMNMDDLYECAISQRYPDIAILFKPRYLRWTIQEKGIEAARELYLKIVQRPPYSEKLHEVMLFAEDDNDQNKITKQVLELWTEQFGTEYIEFSRITFKEDYNKTNIVSLTRNTSYTYNGSLPWFESFT